MRLRLVDELGDEDDGGEDGGHEGHRADHDVQVRKGHGDLKERFVPFFGKTSQGGDTKMVQVTSSKLRVQCISAAKMEL